MTSRALLALAAVTGAALGAGLPGPSGVAAAETVQQVVRPTDDAYTAQDAPSTAHDSERLVASNRPGGQKVTYLRFALPDVITDLDTDLDTDQAATDDATTDSLGLSARLVLQRDNHHLPGSVELSLVEDSAWSERSLTYRNAPDLGERLGRVAPTRSTSQVSFDVPRDLLRAGAVLSLAVTSSVTDDEARFRAGEFGAEGPRLVFSYQRDPGSPDPDDPNLRDTWIGAAASDPAAGGGIDYGVEVFNQSNQDIGPLVYRRSFDSTLPTSFQTSAAAQDAANGYRSFVSWKPPNGDYVGAAEGRYDPQVSAWARSVPDTGVYATSFHEPENDMTGPQFVALQRHLYTVVKEANPSIRWGPVYMAYWWDDGTSHYIGDKDAWWPGNAYADFTAVDVYSNFGQPLETHPEFRGWYDYMLGTGEEMIIAEYGQYVVPPGQTADPDKLAERADLITEDALWLAEQDTISMWLYWDAMGDKGDWRLNDEQSQRAWSNVSGAGRGAGGGSTESVGTDPAVSAPPVTVPAASGQSSSRGWRAA